MQRVGCVCRVRDAESGVCVWRVGSGRGGGWM